MRRSGVVSKPRENTSHDGSASDSLTLPDRQRIGCLAVVDQQLDLARFAFEERRELSDVDAGLLAAQEVFHRQAAAPLVRPDNNLVDLIAFRPDVDRLVERDDLFDGYLGRAIAIGHVAENHEAAAIGAPAHALLDQRGARASAEHEHAPLDRLGIDHAREADAERRDENEAEQDRDAEHAAPHAELRHHVVEDDEADRAAGERGEKSRQDAEPRIAQVHLVEAERDHAEHDERAERAGAEHQMPGEHALRIRIGEIPEMRRKPERERQQSELAHSEHEQPAPRVVAQKTQHVASYAPCECVPWRQG